MTRNHRAAHRLVWPALGLLAAFGFLMALVLRAPAATPAPVSAVEEIVR